MKTIFDELQQEVKNWWISLILGILYVIVAISLMFSPLSGYAVLSILFSVSMLFSGLLEISFADDDHCNGGHDRHVAMPAGGIEPAAASRPAADVAERSVVLEL